MSVVVNENSGQENQHDRTLRALAEAKNWKQALAHVEKRMKKVKSDRLTMNKALLQLRSNDARSYDQAITLLSSSLDALSPIKDKDVLQAIDDVAVLFPESQQLQHLSAAMWDKTLKARPNDDGLLNELFERKMFASDWDAARKLAMTRMKTQRDWFFRYIICLHLSARSKCSNLPDSMKAMNAGLACKSLSKAAADVIPDQAYATDPTPDPGIPGEVKLKNPSSSSKSIETHLELDLLIEILRSHGKYADLLVILEDDTRTGVRSRIGNNLSTLKDKIQTLRACHEWKRLWHVCDELLRPVWGSHETPSKSLFGKLADDWEIWQSYLEASLHLHSSDGSFLHEAVALTVSASQTANNQNALLVLMDHGSRHGDKHAQQDQFAIDYAEKYYHLHSSKPYVFRQLRRVYHMSINHQTRLLSYGLRTGQEQGSKPLAGKYLRRAWIYTEINSLKLDYYLVVSRMMHGSSTLPEAFISSCLRLYSLSFLWNVDCESEADGSTRETEGPTDRHPGDDAALLAAVTLVRLYFLGHKESLIRAIFLLETVLRHSKHNYDAILLAIRVYVYMGQSGRAFELFKGLDVKNVQNLSTLWMLICRTSTLHPHASKHMRCDPMETLREANNWMRNSQKSVRRTLAACLAERSYRNLVRTIEIFESITTSISSIMIMAEISRSHWLSTTQRQPELPRGAFDGQGYSDTREYSVFPDYEHPSQLPIEKMLRPGPLPEIHWCRSRQRFLALIQIWQGNPIHPEDSTAISDIFSTPVGHHEKLAPKAINHPDMTQGELLEDSILRISFDFCMLACIKKDRAQTQSLDESQAQSIKNLTQICTILTDLANLKSILPEIKGNTNWLQAFTWSRLHNIYQRVYNLKALLAALRLLASLEQQWNLTWGFGNGHFLAEAKQLESLARSAIEYIKNWAKSNQGELKKSEYIESVVEAIFGKSSAVSTLRSALIGFESKENICVDKTEFSKSLITGWIDTLDGFAILDESRV